MAPDAALKLAIDLLHVPSRVRHVRSAPLPRGVSIILQIAAGDGDVIRAQAALIERPAHVLEEAASFFIEQILFCAQADSYRVLGATSEASTLELRQNMALLLRWVHPDLDRAGARSSFAIRVSRAWDNLKTPERRRSYDAKRANAASGSALAKKQIGRRSDGTNPNAGTGPMTGIYRITMDPRSERVGRARPRHGVVSRVIAFLFDRS